MNCILKSALILLFTIYVVLGKGGGSDDKTSYCKYYNDPHLIPFAKVAGEVQDQFLCQNKGEETLLKNDVVEIIVTPDPTGEYPIIAYTLIFFATSTHTQPCIIKDSIASPSPLRSLSCQRGSPANSVAPSTSDQHHLHLTENLQVDITNRGSFFNILITQSYDLIEKSTGVCVKWDCGEPEKIDVGRKKRQIRPNTISDIVDVAVKIALNNALGEVDEHLVGQLRTAVKYDITQTLVLTYLETIAKSILRNSVSDRRGDADFAEYLLKADAVAEKVICETGPEVKRMIEQSARICKEVNGERRCLQYVGYGTQCSRS